MRVRPSLSRHLGLVLGVAVGLVFAAPALAGPSAAIDRPEYQPTEEGFQHFVQDTLGLLVQDKTWEWAGHEFAGQRLHRISRAEVDRLEAPASRDHGAGLRGWTVAIVHVKVDGQVKRAKVAGNASFTSDGAGWRWTEVLLYLGVGDSYDFVSGKLR